MINLNNIFSLCLSFTFCVILVVAQIGIKSPQPPPGSRNLFFYNDTQNSSTQHVPVIVYELQSNYQGSNNYAYNSTHGYLVSAANRPLAPGQNATFDFLNKTRAKIPAGVCHEEVP